MYFSLSTTRINLKRTHTFQSFISMSTQCNAATSASDIASFLLLCGAKYPTVAWVIVAPTIRTATKLIYIYINQCTECSSAWHINLERLDSPSEQCSRTEAPSEMPSVLLLAALTYAVCIAMRHTFWTYLISFTLQTLVTIVDKTIILRCYANPIQPNKRDGSDTFVEFRRYSFRFQSNCIEYIPHVITCSKYTLQTFNELSLRKLRI